MEKLNALVVGCGSIGALKPDKFDHPGSENILTHCNAYDKHDKINLVGVVDTDITKVNNAAVKWNTEPYINIHEAFKHHKIDIVSVCVPTRYHHSVMMELLQYDFKILIAEKPFCNNSGEAMSVIKEYKKAGRPIVVDYIRHFDPTISNLKYGIKNIVDDKVYSTRIIYNRGLRHEACHGIALCNYLFGYYKGGQILKSGHIKELDGDISYSVQMSFEKCDNVILTPLDGRNYSIFDVDIFSETQRWNLIDHGKILYMYSTRNEKTYGDYRALDYRYNSLHTQLTKALFYLVDNAVNHIESGETIICTAQDALEVHEIYESLIEGKNNGK